MATVFYAIKQTGVNNWRLLKCADGRGRTQSFWAGCKKRHPICVAAFYCAYQFTSPRLYVFSASFVIRNTSLYTKSISEKMKKLSVDLENINGS